MVSQVASGYYADVAERFGYEVEHVVSDVWLPSNRTSYLQECHDFMMSIARGIAFLAILVVAGGAAYLAYKVIPYTIFLFIILPASAICIVWLYRTVFSAKLWERSTLAFGDSFFGARQYRKTLCPLLQSANPERMWVNSAGELCSQFANGLIINVHVVPDHSEVQSVAVASFKIPIARTRQKGRLSSKVLKQRYGSFSPIQEASRRLLNQYLVAEGGLLYYVIEAPMYNDGAILKKVLELALRAGQEISQVTAE